MRRRIKYHNKGRNRSTKNGIPWEIVCYKMFKQEKKAYEEEKRIKSYKGGNAFKKIVRGEVASAKG